MLPYLLNNEKPFADTAPISGGRLVKVLYAKKQNGTVVVRGWNITTAQLPPDAKAVYSIWRKEIEQQPQAAALINTLTDADSNTLKQLLCKYQ